MRTDRERPAARGEQATVFRLSHPEYFKPGARFARVRLVHRRYEVAAASVEGAALRKRPVQRRLAYLAKHPGCRVEAKQGDAGMSIVAEMTGRECGPTPADPRHPTSIRACRQALGGQVGGGSTNHHETSVAARRRVAEADQADQGGARRPAAFERCRLEASPPVGGDIVPAIEGASAHEWVHEVQSGGRRLVGALLPRTPASLNRKGVAAVIAITAASGPAPAREFRSCHLGDTGCPPGVSEAPPVSPSASSPQFTACNTVFRTCSPMRNAR